METERSTKHTLHFILSGNIILSGKGIVPDLVYELILVVEFGGLVQCFRQRCLSRSSVVLELGSLV